MPTARGSIPGDRNKHHVAFYGISTCVWCKRTRRFLENQGVAFEYTYVDLVPAWEREEVVAQVRRWNPRASYPTIVIDGSKTIVGYQPEEIKEVLGL